MTRLVKHLIAGVAARSVLESPRRRRPIRRVGRHPARARHDVHRLRSAGGQSLRLVRGAEDREPDDRRPLRPHRARGVGATGAEGWGDDRLCRASRTAFHLRLHRQLRRRLRAVRQQFRHPCLRRQRARPVADTCWAAVAAERRLDLLEPACRRCIDPVGPPSAIQAHPARDTFLHDGQGDALRDLVGKRHPRYDAGPAAARGRARLLLRPAHTGHAARSRRSADGPRSGAVQPWPAVGRADRGRLAEHLSRPSPIRA